MVRPAEPDADPRQGSGGEPPARAARRSGQAVLVGVDGSDSSRAAIVLAAREARYRNAPLIAIQAYSGERVLGAPAARPASALRTHEDERTDAECRLRDAVLDALGDQAEGVELHALLGLAGRRIVETARWVNAQLIVLTGRGSTSMLLGTVSQYVLRKAPCPVLVVPASPVAARPAVP
jgi:nucleotide-binding universal stress UspA family protein